MFARNLSSVARRFGDCGWGKKRPICGETNDPTDQRIWPRVCLFRALYSCLAHHTYSIRQFALFFSSERCLTRLTPHASRRCADRPATITCTPHARALEVVISYDGFFHNACVLVHHEQVLWSNARASLASASPSPAGYFGGRCSSCRALDGAKIRH